MKIVLSFLLLLFSMSSCIEIIDDVTMNADGSGTFKYSVNLSASKVKISSALSLDSLNGKRVPNRDEIISTLEKFRVSLSKKEGISNVEIEQDMSNYIFKLSCDFKNVELLQKAIVAAIDDETSGKQTVIDENMVWVKWTGESLIRSIPEFTLKQTRSLDEAEATMLKNGNYISITRFDRPVKEFSNEKAILAKNKLAVMLRTNAYSLIQNPNLLENTIYLSTLKP